MSLTTFLVLSVAMAISVGLFASFLLRAWMKKPPQTGSVKLSVHGYPESSDGKGAQE